MDYTFGLDTLCEATYMYMRYLPTTYVTDSTSETSDDSIEKKKEAFKPDIKVEYTNSIYGNPIDAWQQDLDPKQYRHSAEYDELKFNQGPPPKVSGDTGHHGKCGCLLLLRLSGYW